MFITHNGMDLVKIHGNVSIDKHILYLGAREKYVVSFSHKYVAFSVQGTRFRYLLDGFDSASNINENQECFLGVKEAGE
jgi:hypothetical protein